MTWFAFDMDEGLIAVGRSRLEVMRLADCPTRSQWRGPWKRHRYGGGGEEITYRYRGEDQTYSLFLESSEEEARARGWDLSGWQLHGCPVDVRMDGRFVSERQFRPGPPP